MPDLDLIARGIAIGVAGSAAMDLWSAVLRRRFGVSGLDYRLLDRWIGHVQRGRFVHKHIALAESFSGELALGWVAHYAIGVAFALLLVAMWGRAWADAPTIGPALVVGLGTVVAPWFVMQPAMGAGFAGSSTPNPAATRLRNVASHAVYGLALYGSAIVLAA